MRSLATRVSEGSGTGLARWPLANLSPIGFKSHGEEENAAVAALIIRSASYAIRKHFNWFIYLCSTTRSRPDVSCTAYFLLSIFNSSAHGHWSAVWTRWAVREWKSSHRSHLENKKGTRSARMSDTLLQRTHMSEQRYGSKKVTQSLEL